jgi:hypothetical protein
VEKRVKIFYAQDCAGLEAEINSFLENTCGKLQDVKFASNAVWDSTDHEAMEILLGVIIYTPDED